MNKQQLATKIWASANKMRSKIEANEYKDYILGFIFYKFLSDQEVRFAKEQGMSENEMESQLIEEDEETVRYIQQNLGYFISYNNLYSTWIAQRSDIKDIREALSAFSRLIADDYKKVFSGIFDTLQTGLSKLGTSDPERTKAARDLLSLIRDIPMNGRQDYDVLGFIYEYLISQFAANAGKKAGEFYTPHEVSLLMSEIVAHHLRDREKIEIYDPTSGSGSLLINIGKSVARHLQKEDGVKYYAQELKANTHNLTRMNLVMRGTKPANIITRNGDTLKDDWPFFEENDPEGSYEPLFVDAVVSNPPYSQGWTPPRKSKKDTGGKHDPRFEYGIAPKGKADYAFLLHDLYHLRTDGVMTIVLPHGVLFRGDPGDGSPENPGDNSEGSIRRQLIENNRIDTIIGLPADIFFGTGIPTIIMVLKKEREGSDVLFIDASKGFKKEGKKNKLRASDIKRIVDTYISRKSETRFSRLVKKDEIRNNGYNLNIPRYVNSSDDPETWDMYATMFGGLPQEELKVLQKYWDAFPGLFEILFDVNDTPYTSLMVADVAPVISSHHSVNEFRENFKTVFDDLPDFLYSHLIDNVERLKITEEESGIAQHIFNGLSDIPLIDRYDAYQLFADNWSVISQDLEIIQSEGFESTRVVDPNMVVKKKDDKEEDVQDGWIGHVLPFDLVQRIHLYDRWQDIRRKRERLDFVNSEIETIVAELDEEDKESVSNDDGVFSAKEAEMKLSELLMQVETPEILALQDYLECTKKADKLAFISVHKDINWEIMDKSKDGTVSAKVINNRIAELRNRYPFDDGTLESQLIKILELITESKRLKSEIKSDSADLHVRTKDVIENDLSDDDVRDLLRLKWIEPLYQQICKLPDMVIDDFIKRVKTLNQKYETTLVEIERNIRSTSDDLAQMIDDLRGSDYDMKALSEFKVLLKNI